MIFQMQEISNYFIACEIGLWKLNSLGLLAFSPQNEDKGVQVWQGVSLSIPAVSATADPRGLVP